MRESDFRVIIAGSRTFNDYPKLKKIMDKLLENKRKVRIVCGLARGADRLGEQYGKERHYDIDYYPADWDQYGISAGYVRNAEMANNADALVAFWDGESKGTKNMIELARKRNLQVRIINYE